MKKLLFIAALMTASISFAGNGNGTDEPTATSAVDPGAINKAQGAIRSTCSDATGDLSYGTEVVSACFVDGFITKVHFYRVPNCPPGMICPLYIQLIGTVTLDCDNNVIDVECAVNGI